MLNVKGITVEIKKEEATDLILYLLDNLIDKNKLTKEEAKAFTQIKSCLNEFDDTTNTYILELITKYEGMSRLR